jgi:putative colanic acid biosynthesis acetyltransferase WcaF
MYNQDTHCGPSFAFENRMKRALWSFVSFFVFEYSPKPFHAWRSFILRCFGAKVGRGVHVYPKVKIWAPWNLELLDECGIANEVILYSQDKIVIGRRSVISQGTHLCTGTHDYSKPGFPLITMPIYIGDDVWIASETFVHPGISIGSGSVIGARSVVVKDMPKRMICTGHPCTPIKERKFFNDVKIDDDLYLNI